MHAFDVRHGQLIASIEDELKHPYLEQYINKPFIDEEKLYILSNIINNTNLPTNKKRQYIITTMLVQIALDTHDLVPVSNNNNESEEDEVSRQLFVLAGDYYSVLYYLLLAKIDDVEMIHLLASAIKEINEYKMILYYKESMSFEKYIDYVEKVNALLIIRVAERFTSLPVLNNITSRLLITSKLIDEKRNIYNQSFSPILDDWLHHSTNNHDTSVYSHIEMIIQKNTKEIEQSVSKYSDQLTMFRKSIDYLLNELIYKKTSIVEEG